MYAAGPLAAESLPIDASSEGRPALAGVSLGGSTAGRGALCAGLNWAPMPTTGGGGFFGGTMSASGSTCGLTPAVFGLSLGGGGGASATWVGGACGEVLSAGARGSGACSSAGGDWVGAPALTRSIGMGISSAGGWPGPGRPKGAAED